MLSFWRRRPPPVSVVIPVHNSAATLAGTLDCLLRQSFEGWEAIVVDNGSSDSSRDIARAYGKRDKRIRVLHQPEQGPSAARNRGIRKARGEWLLFLDSDDWIADDAIETFLAAAREAPGAGVLCAGWTRVAPDGTEIPEDWTPDLSDPVPLLARFCPFAIHSCFVRRSTVIAAGGFDTGLRVAEDWDLWQKIARRGARFAGVPRTLAYYRMRKASAGLDVERLVEHGLEVIRRAHAPYESSSGMPADALPDARLNYICWPAGMLIALGRDARPLLNHLPGESAPGLDPSPVASTIFRAALLPHCLTPDRWIGLWPSAEPAVDDFLAALERKSGCDGLARRAKRELALLAMRNGAAQAPFTLGPIMAAEWDVTNPAPEITAGPEVERLFCTVRCAGATLGEIQLPICDGRVPAGILSDAVASRFAWQILGHYFSRSVYTTLSRDPEEPGRLLRDGLCLIEDMSDDLAARPDEFHDRVGWAVFLQELWGQPDWPADRFYDPGAGEADEEEGETEPVAEPIIVEVSGELDPAGSTLLMVKAGGAAVTLLDLDEPVRTARQAIVAVTSGTGLELCRVAVREALIGRSWDGGASLRERLALAAAERAAFPAPLPEHVAGEGPLEAGWPLAPPDASVGAETLIFARHHYGVPGTSISRRAALPGAARDALLRSARANGETVLGRIGDTARQLVYAPDIIALRQPDMGKGTGAGADAPSMFDRHFFETTFIEAADPWKYDAPYEQLKYEQTLSLIPAGAGDVLELACAEGHFTRQLAPLVQSLTATDIAAVALERAAERCRDHANIGYRQLDLSSDDFPGAFDVIICSEVLYYLQDERRIADFARRVAASLKPGGCLITAHTHVAIDDPDSPGLSAASNFLMGAKRIGEILGESLRLETELRSDLYRIQRFRAFVDGEDAAEPTLQQIPHNAPDESIADRFAFEKAAPVQATPLHSAAHRLPILMYHSVAPDGPASYARYRVTPERFEEQLAYLRSAGFRSVSLDEWRVAKEQWRPIPGRAVMLTFDDGFLDFHDHAWPLLQRYGFSAVMFLVAGRIGLHSDWDEGVELPLLGWDHIRKMSDAGIAFGSHATRHVHLTGLSPADIVREAAESRAILTEGLGRPVPAFAYPFGAEDEVVQHLVGASGYIYGLSTRSGPSDMSDSLLALHRIEIEGTDTLPDFIAKLP